MRALALGLTLLTGSVTAADLGTWGDLWPVAEPDMLTVIESRLQTLAQSGEMDKKMAEFKARVVRNSQRPPAVEGITRAVRYERRWFDPSVRVDKALADDRGNVFAQAGQVFNPLDVVASAAKTSVDALFWCAGSQGSMYPFNGWVSNESSPLQSSVLVSERMAFKLHRQGQIMESVGEDKKVCFEYPSPIIPKTRWRYQMVNMYPDVAQCHPFGRTVMRWETGRNPPNTKKNYGYLLWRKRNCVFL